eukprot:6264837-Amphidinium_carterae.3
MAEADVKETKLLQAEWEQISSGISGPKTQKCPQSMAMRALLDHYRTWTEQEIFTAVSPRTGLTLYQHLLQDKRAAFENKPDCPKFSCLYYDNLTQIYASKTNPLKAVQPSVREGMVTPGMRNGILKAKQNSREELRFHLRTHGKAPTEHDVCGLFRWISTLNVRSAKDQLETGLALMTWVSKHGLAATYPAWHKVMTQTWETIVIEAMREHHLNFEREVTPHKCIAGGSACIGRPNM